MKKLSTIVAATALALAFAVPVSGFAQTLSYAGHLCDARSQHVGEEPCSARRSTMTSTRRSAPSRTIMVKASATEPTAVLSVGDYLGTGPKMVAVPLSHLAAQGNDAMMMAGATKAMLESLPIYTIAGG